MIFFIVFNNLCPCLHVCVCVCIREAQGDRVSAGGKGRGGEREIQRQRHRVTEREILNKTYTGHCAHRG